MSSEIKEINAEEIEEKVEAVEEQTEKTEEKKHIIVGTTGDFETMISDEELAKRKKRKEIFDKITTGILIFLMASPVLILAYIFIWFLTK